jgi:Glycosyl hydrolases family 8
MLSALVLAGLLAAPIATVALFLPRTGRPRRAEEHMKWVARLAATLVWAAVLIAAVVGILALIGVTAGNIVTAAAGLTLATLLWLPVTRRWNARAHVCWATTTYVFVVYLAFMIWWTFASHLGIAGDVGGMLLWLLELVAAVLGCAYLWELCDTLGRASWVRRVGTQELAEAPEGPYPFVCLQVPCYNEPPDMVIESLSPHPAAVIDSASTSPRHRRRASPSTTAAATRFLNRYVTSDGRVIRHDQGGDIVSEGQAYAMLIAEVAQRPALVRTIWSWTNERLGRPDGLFAWHATGSGQILNPQSATDADVLIAYALLRYRGADQAALQTAGRRAAAAVLANEAVTLPDGAPLLVAGPWARSSSPAIVDPSYLMPGVFDALAHLTGDARWDRASAAATAAGAAARPTRCGPGPRRSR